MFRKTPTSCRYAFKSAAPCMIPDRFHDMPWTRFKMEVTRPTYNPFDSFPLLKAGRSSSMMITASKTIVSEPLFILAYLFFRVAVSFWFA